MEDGINYRVSIQLVTNNIWDIDARVDEIKIIRDWIDELTEWQPDHYFIRVVRENKLDIWFKKPEHAIICVLRWS